MAGNAFGKRYECPDSDASQSDPVTEARPEWQRNAAFPQQPRDWTGSGRLNAAASRGARPGFAPAT